jgi:hypothetical protein
MEMNFVISLNLLSSSGFPRLYPTVTLAPPPWPLPPADAVQPPTANRANSSGIMKSFFLNFTIAPPPLILPNARRDVTSGDRDQAQQQRDRNVFHHGSHLLKVPRPFDWPTLIVALGG